MWKEKTDMKKEDSQIKAYLGEDTIFNGSLNFDGTVRIDGKFEGQVTTKDTLIIGETGHLMAEISAGTVICMGYVEGPARLWELLNPQAYILSWAVCWMGPVI